jgi:DHA2 family multidrug resistance protein
MANTSAIPQQQSDDRVPLKTWSGVIGTIIGAFMVVLDIQITTLLSKRSKQL